MSSTIDPATWQRPPTTFVMTVDVSGSMQWDYPGDEYASPGRLARELLRRLVPDLGSDDRVAIVTYGSEVKVPLGLTAGDQQAGVLDAVEALGGNGSTYMEAGLRRAYEIGAQAVAMGETSEVRLLLFSDVQPNVGATEPTEFEQMAEAGAAAGVHLTVLALGLVALSDVDESQWFATPIAYDLTLAVAPTGGFTVAAKYGFPAGDEPAGLEVATVFLSKRKGALLVALAPGEDGVVSEFGADVTLGYMTPDGGTAEATLTTRYGGQPLDGRGQFFQQDATARTTALALLVSSMRSAASAYSSDAVVAENIMLAAHARFAGDAAALADESLAPEVGFAAALLALIERRAPQGTLYGVY